MRYYLIAACLSIMTAQTAAAQQIRARVIDDATRSAIAGAVVVATKDNDAFRTATGPDGFFTLTLRGTGTYTVTLESVGYQKLDRAITVDQTGLVTLPAFVLNTAVIPIAGVEANADRKRAGYEVGFNRKMFLAAGAELKKLEDKNVAILDALRSFGAGLKIHFTSQNRTPCIESSRGMPGINAGRPVCDMVVIVLDEIIIQDVIGFLRSARLEQFESVQYLPPVEAGQHYGMEASTTGAIVFWTRGRGPHKSADRN
jgi:hypothetical protein